MLLTMRHGQCNRSEATRLIPQRRRDDVVITIFQYTFTGNITIQQFTDPTPYLGEQELALHYPSTQDNLFRRQDQDEIH